MGPDFLMWLMWKVETLKESFLFDFFGATTDFTLISYTGSFLWNDLLKEEQQLTQPRMLSVVLGMQNAVMLQQWTAGVVRVCGESDVYEI